MKVNNRFNIGDIVYHPAVDTNRGIVFKSKVSGIIITSEEGKVVWSYQTDGSYSVKEEDMFKTAKPAKRRLIQILKDKKVSIGKNIDSAIKLLDAKKTDELIYDMTIRYEASEEKPEEPVA